MGKAETASRKQQEHTLPVCAVSGAADSGESRGGGTRAVSIFSFAPYRGVAAALLGFLFAAAFCGRLIPVFAQGAKARYRSHAGALLNDLNETPGAVRTLDRNQVCDGGSTKQFRNTTEKMKNDVYAEYGVDKHKALASGPRPSKEDAAKPLYEIDHLISLELGGEDDEKNLWPQPYYMHPGAHEKDAVENYLHRQVCSGKMELQEAQRAIATDWYQVYLDARLGAPKNAADEGGAERAD